MNLEQAKLEITSTMNHINRHINGEVWLLGDLHGQKDTFLKLCKEHNIRNASIIILGDSEVGLRHEHPNKFYNYLSKQLSLRNNTLYLIRGNHDNPWHWFDDKVSVITGKRQEEWTATTLEEKWPNIIHLEDEFVLINNKIYYVFGGAVSIDRNILKTDSTYFEDERTSNINAKWPRPCHVEGILAHTGPRPAGLDTKMIRRRLAEDKRLGDDIRQECINIDQLIFRTNPKNYYYGHFHVSWDGEYCTYNNLENSVLLPKFIFSADGQQIGTPSENGVKTKCKCLNICELYKIA